MTVTRATPFRRVCATWNYVHTPVAAVPRRSRLAAYTIPFLVLPSSVWRIMTVAVLQVGADANEAGNVPSWLPMELYVVLLSIFSELLAFTAVGLIAGWGEVVPRWVPCLGGRGLPALAVVVPAAIGAAALTFMCTLVGVTASLGRDVHGRPLSSEVPLHSTDWHGMLTIAAYAPLLLWGPLLGFVTVAYWQRRRRQSAYGHHRQHTASVGRLACRWPFRHLD